MGAIQTLAIDARDVRLQLSLMPQCLSLSMNLSEKTVMTIYSNLNEYAMGHSQSMNFASPPCEPLLIIHRTSTSTLGAW